MSLKTGFAQIFTRRPENLSCPKFEGAGCSPPRPNPPPPRPVRLWVNVFHLPVEIGLLPFYKHGFLKLHLVLSGCRVQDLEATGVQDALQNSELCRCLKTFEDLSESKCSRTRVKKCQLVSPT